MKNHISQSDAKAQNLHGHDVFKTSHILYTDDINRDMDVVRLCIEAYRVFTNTIAVHHRHELRLESLAWKKYYRAGGISSGIAMPNDYFSLLRFEYFNFEMLKISTGFELCLKAILIQNNVIVHEIDQKSEIYENLAKEQKTRPVLKFEIIALDGFRFDGKINYLHGIKTSSIPFSTILKQKNYAANTGISSYDLSIINEYRDLRNQIHFPGDIPETPKLNAHKGSSLDFLIDFINKEIVHRANEISNFYNRPELKLDSLD